MRYCYSLLIYLALPFILLRLWGRGRQRPEYRLRWKERLGYSSMPQRNNSVWVHAVSYGEVVAAEPLIRQLLNSHPDKTIIVTTMTPTGSERVRATFGARVEHSYVPYDLPGAVRRFLSRINPSQLILMEMEVWPNLIYACARRNIPILLANARLSKRSFKGYKKISCLIRPTLRKINNVLAQSTKDAHRFKALGVSEAQIRVTGSIKFDLDIDASKVQLGKNLRASMPEEALVWVAASTHAGEEAICIKTFIALKEKMPCLKLILVPRHTDRAEEVEKLCQAYVSAQHISRRSQYEALTWPADCEVLIIDTMGELLSAYAASDVAWVGGSLVAVGGHNPIEPLALGVASLIGPYYFKNQSSTQYLIEQGALWEVVDADALAQKLFLLLKDKPLRDELASRGRALVESSRGALNVILGLMNLGR